MPPWLSVLLKILAMFLVILVGWMARRRGYLSAETTRALSRFVVDLTMPALIFTQMLGTVSGESLRADWFLPLLGGGVLILGNLVGLGLAPLFTRRGERSTFIFLAMIANWVYLPLPIIQTLYGADGVRMLLLTNVGSQIVLWTLGVWALRGGRPDLSSLKNLATNPGLIATFVGIAVALFVPGAKSLDMLANASATGGHAVTAGGGALVASAFYAALKLVGDMTVPLSLVMTGAQLGELEIADHRPSWPLTGVILARLAVAPVFAVLICLAIARLWAPIPETPRMVAYIIACMPVAIDQMQAGLPVP